MRDSGLRIAGAAAIAAVTLYAVTQTLSWHRLQAAHVERRQAPGARKPEPDRPEGRPDGCRRLRARSGPQVVGGHTARYRGSAQRSGRGYLLSRSSPIRLEGVGVLLSPQIAKRTC